MSNVNGEVVFSKHENCPMCGKKVIPKYRPFCSSHCADYDLGNWLDEKYRIPLSKFGEYDEE